MRKGPDRFFHVFDSYGGWRTFIPIFVIEQIFTAKQAEEGAKSRTLGIKSPPTQKKNQHKKQHRLSGRQMLK